MRRQWLGDLATICPPPSSLQPTTGACSSYRLRAVSLDAEHLANVITLCDATLRAGGLMSNAHHSQRLRLLFTKGIRVFYRAANGSHLPSDARCSQLLRLGHPSVGNWARVSGAETDSSSECSAANGRLPCPNWHQYLWNRRRHGRQSDELFLTRFPRIHRRKF